MLIIKKNYGSRIHRLLFPCKSKRDRFDIASKYVIHTVGPVWHGGTKSEPELLASCYRRSLEVAVENGVKLIAFPCISTGVYHYPKDQACKIAVETVEEFLKRNGEISKVIFVCFNLEDFSLYQNRVAVIEE
jgi:O-acetyl-ADP-ribose deacetylase (regulator of RNase III)